MLAILFLSGCQILKTGVLEIKNKIQISIEENFYFAVVVEDDNNDYVPGVEFNYKPTSPNYSTFTAVYWPDKSAKDLGYNYGGCGEDQNKFVSGKECESTKPGKYGNWAGDIVDDPTDPIDPQPGNTITLLSETVSGDAKSTITFKVVVPTGTKTLNVRLSEESINERQSADLVVRKGSAAVIKLSPSYSWTADCASIRENRETESCSFQNPPSGDWYVTVYGYNTFFVSLLKVTITK